MGSRATRLGEERPRYGRRMTWRSVAAQCSSGQGRSVAGLLTLAAAVLAGCSVSAEETSAEEVATRFVATLSTPEAACALLAPGTRAELMDRNGSSCAAALADENLPRDSTAVTAVSVAGHSAQVVLGGTEVVFLARFDDGWRVTAAGCSRSSDDVSAPYDCSVKGA